MKIAFFSEIGSDEGLEFPRNFQNMRTDCSWAVALGAKVYSFNAYANHIDLGIIIVPKNNPSKAFNYFKMHQSDCIKWAVMQESDQIYWQRYNIPDQIQYLNLLGHIDIIFCHNKIDKTYFEGLIPGKRVEVLQSLLIEDAIPQASKIIPENRNGCCIGGTWSDWYSGQDSFLVAREFEEQIYAPSMGRKQKYEDHISEITYMPYVDWQHWMLQLNQFKYAIHLMRIYAAGTFQLNCSRLSIPCIGYENSDTMRLCQPLLKIQEGDLIAARYLAKKLKNDKYFYEECSKSAFENYNKYFIEEVFIEKFNKILLNK